MSISILIIYHSQTGNTLEMARAVAEGVDDVEGARAVLKPAGDATLDDLLACAGLAVGSPEYFGYMSGMVKDFFDRTFYPARGKSGMHKKPYVTFISAGNDGAGALLSIRRIAKGYPLKQVYEPVVAKGPVTPDHLAACRELGQTIAAGCELGIY